MTQKPRKHNTGCAVAFGVDIFGDRWTLLILRDMLIHGKTSFSEFLDAGEEIATNILTTRLKLLEDEGIILKKRDPRNGRKFIYRPTEKGLALTPVIFEIVRWSARFYDLTPERVRLAQRIEDEREVYLQEIRTRVTEKAPE